MSPKINFYKLIFVLASLISFFFIDKGYDVLELLFKLVTILSLLFYYLKKTKEINYWYLLIILFSCVISSILIFDAKFLFLGTYLMLANRIFYIVIGKRALKNINNRTLIMFFLIFLIPLIIIFPQFESNLKGLTYPILGIGIASVIMCSLAFVNYFNKMVEKNKYFAFGLLLLVLADILITYNKFINYELYHVIIYTSFYYIARYLICEAMIVEKN